MYGENGQLLRAELTALLKHHRIQMRIGGEGTHAVPVTTTEQERVQIGEQLRRYRQSAVVWCLQATIAVGEGAESRLSPRAANPFRLPAAQHGGLAVLRQALDNAVRASTASLPGLEELTAQQELPLVEHWRQVARAAALGEHDFDAGLGHGRLDDRQLHTLIGDIAAVVRALVILDQRYLKIPGWEPLDHPDRLGWAALACALDASLDPPDYSIDLRGWRPKTKLITGAAKPGLLGVLQAEHNLSIRLRAFPSALNLRLVVDSQRLVSAGLAARVQKVEPELHKEWLAREQTYVGLQRELRNIGGKVGVGELAVAEASNAWGRLKVLPPDADLDPRIVHAFTTLFAKLDARIADIVEEGIQRQAYFLRVNDQGIATGRGRVVAPAEERFVPLAGEGRIAIVELVRSRLRPAAVPADAPPGAARSRAELHAAIVHQPERRHPGPRRSGI